MRISKPKIYRCPACSATDIILSSGPIYTDNDFETSVGVSGVYLCNTCHHSERYFIASEDMMKSGHKNAARERWQHLARD